MSIGQTLAEARIRAGLSVRRLSETTRVRQILIEAIERDDYQPCGGDFYARGHIRILAGELGLDPAPLLAEYDVVYGGGSTPRPAQIFRSPRRSVEHRRPNWTAATIIAVAIVLIFAFVQLAGGRPDDERSSGQGAPAGPAAPGSSPAAAAAPPAPPATDVSVSLEAVGGRSHVRAVDDAGRPVVDTVLARGEIRRLIVPRLVRLQIGNAGAVRMTVNGRDLGPAGRGGQSARHTFVPGDPLGAGAPGGGTAPGSSR